MAWQDELTALATRRGAALVGYAYLLCGDLPRAHDLVQEALVRSWSRPARVLGPQATEGYVRRAVLHAFLDEHRRDRTWAGRRHLAAAPAVAPDPTAQTDDQVVVQQALSGLPPRERACVVLRFYDDLTVPELARRLGISEGTAKRYLSDGLRRLEDTLGPLGSDERLTVDLTEGER
ncbi:sigma-70 family RNA polymerase sigma factor [Actinotalea sp. M2MS4P-6]|uniref:sigma-70 family RNA polymerase sigma factor n=1 Tax=Actinotalea sp. M2MS4P-6 TaxID=2983762 RepID=UPI0021E41FEB|nr:sigma-70 family RNA polymerase sigma factor [Actinotalea sp. M2MS4P-6]MCV2393230.1 sigma-70 family RNA polymerase sigma factor [Actinotalea sp. M2MS4P-6]